MALLSITSPSQVKQQIYFYKRIQPALSARLHLTTPSFKAFTLETKMNTHKVVNTKRSIKILQMMLGLSLLSSLTFASYANTLFTLKNLERERATLISDFLNTNIDVQQKHQRMQQKQRQLADMERMVLRDERLLVTQSGMVVNAFKEYERTFLVHAGAENKISAMNQWLNNIKLTNELVLNAKAGYR
jgi:cytochrome c biogenesis factor